MTKVYRSIDLNWAAATKHLEVTSLFAAAAALLLVLGAGVSVAPVRTGGVADVLPLRYALLACWPSRYSSPHTCGSCAGASAPRCRSPTSR